MKENHVVNKKNPNFAVMNALHKKLRLKEGQRIGLVNRPGDFNESMLPLPAGCTISKNFSYKDDVIFWFVKTEAEMQGGTQEVFSALSSTNVIWISYPKGTSGMQTNLTRDKGWDTLTKRDDLTFTSFIAFNKTWSTFCVRKKTNADARREEKNIEREIFKYADPKARTITLPEDLAQTFSGNKKAKDFFETLSFSDKKEFVEWVVTAQRPETRTARIQGTLIKLSKGLRNPAAKN